MRSKGFKAKFMMAFWGLFVEAHYIAANNDTMEGSQGILPFIILLIVSICVIAFLSYYMYRLKKENIAKGGELMARNDELLRSVDALSVKNREIQQMLVNKIRETDNWNRDNEVEREDLKKRLEEMEKLHNSFFVETIHEMRTPLSLVLGSLSELSVKNREIQQMLTLVKRLNYCLLTVIPWLFKTLSSNCEIPVMEMTWQTIFG